MLLGAINLGKAPQGGEEYKNQLLFRYLQERYLLNWVDTSGWKRKPQVLFQLIWKAFFCPFDVILISASSATTYRLVQFMHVWPSRLSKTVYLVVGGYFPGAVLAGRFKAKYFRRLKAIVVQGTKLQQELAAAGLEEMVSVMSNFKPVPRLFGSNDRFTDTPFRFVFLSRISREKGVSEIFEAVQKLADKFEFIVDFYGPIEEGYRSTFEQHLSQNPACRYLGYLDLINDPEVAYEKLAQYHTLVFPTYWKGEGFPGVILDAYITGLPVIASDWNMNAELVQDGQTGWLIPPRDAGALAIAMAAAMQNRQETARISEACHTAAIHYDVEKVLGKSLLPLLES